MAQQRVASNVVRMFEGSIQPAEREPPRNLMAERAILGALLAQNNVIDQLDWLFPHHFTVALHAALYAEVIRRIAVAKGPVDSVSMQGWVSSRAELDGDNKEKQARIILTSLISSTIGYKLSTYVDSLKECGVRRAGIDVATSMLEAAYDQASDRPFGAQIYDFQAALDRATAEDVHEAKPLSTFDNALALAVEAAEAAKKRGGPGGLKYPPGYPRLERALPMLPSENTIIGGRSGAGKSALGWGLATGMAREMRDSGLPVAETGGVLAFSFEMSDESLGRRSIAAAAGVDTADMIAGRLTDMQLESCKAAQKELAGLPLRYIALGGLTPARMERRFDQA